MKPRTAMYRKVAGKLVVMSEWLERYDDVNSRVICRDLRHLASNIYRDIDRLEGEDDE